MTMTDTDRQDGRVVAIAGPVIDVEFPLSSLPELNSALSFEIEIDGDTQTVLAEVAQQLGHGRVRAVCLKPTDGLTRGTPVQNIGHGIQVPVGEKVLGHVWNVWGEALDEDPEGFDEMERWDIHRPAPTVRRARAVGPPVPHGHQGHRPAHPVRGRRQDRPVRRCRCRQDRAHHRDDQPRRFAARWCVGVRRCGRAHP